MLKKVGLKNYLCTHKLPFKLRQTWSYDWFGWLGREYFISSFTSEKTGVEGTGEESVLNHTSKNLSMPRPSIVIVLFSFFPSLCCNHVRHWRTSRQSVHPKNPQKIIINPYVYEVWSKIYQFLWKLINQRRFLVLCRKTK